MHELGVKEAAVARLLACYDFRLKEDRMRIANKLGYTEKHVSEIIRRLRGMGKERLWPQHIRDIRHLSLATVLVRTRRCIEGDPRTLGELPSYGVPLHRFLYSYRVVMHGLCIYSYLVPWRFLDEALEGITDGLGGETDVGITVPVRPLCRDPPAMPGKEDEEEAAAMLHQSPRPQPLELLDLVIYSALDINPLHTLRELQDVSEIVSERLGRRVRVLLNYSKLRRRYIQLSSSGLIGRVLVYRAVWGASAMLHPLYVEVEKSCAARLYASAKSLWAATNVFLGEEAAATVMLIPDEYSERLRRSLRGCIRLSDVITSGFGAGLPIDMYSPKKGWCLEPQPLPRLLEGLGLAEIEEATG